MKIEKLIFLDFDGVVITQRTKFLRFDPVCMKLLQKIVDETNAFIVISSSWKIGNTFRAIHAMFDGWGMFDRVIGMTPNHAGEWVRGEEIDEWLKNPKLASNKLEMALESFIILDDDKDMEPHMNRLIQTAWDDGLSEKDVERAIKMLTSS